MMFLLPDRRGSCHGQAPDRLGGQISQAVRVRSAGQPGPSRSPRHSAQFRGAPSSGPRGHGGRWSRAGRPYGSGRDCRRRTGGFPDEREVACHLMPG
jgi:hypothetical protein